MKSKIWDVVQPVLFFFLCMIAVTAVGMSIASFALNINIMNYQALTEKVRALPLYLSASYYALVLILMMVPFEILLLPLYRMLIKAHLTDTYFGVILPYLVPPFMIFFFRQYVLGLPKELLEAARIDGCTDYGVFFKIMVPNMIPAYGAMTILSCMNSWNNLLWPLIVLSSNEKFTIPIGMGTTITPYGNAFDVLMPGAVMAVVPIIIVYLFAQKTFIAGLTSGSVKG